MVRAASRPTPIPMPTFAPVLRLLALFVDAAVELEGEAEAETVEARDEGSMLEVISDEVDGGTAVFRDMVVEVAVALVVIAIVYPAAE